MSGERTVIESRALQLYSDSLDLPADQRQQWIEARAADPMLRAAALRLLAADTGEAGLLDRHPLSIESTDLSGTRLGSYRLLERIASGGMGTVYRGERADGAFEQTVAIKLIRAELAGPDLLQRFVAERQILARLEHPGIARLIDGGDAQGMPFLVMEFVDGVPIDQYCREHTLDLVARLKLLLRLCDALQSAHALGVVHRDIKPGNILVSAAGEPKLLDFGIAKIMQGTAWDSRADPTRTGMLAMTPRYASPEQIRGEAVAASSDVYSLGVMAYELLTGSRPYLLEGMSPAALEQSICNSVPANPSAVVRLHRMAPPAGLDSPRALSRQLHGDVDRIVMSALAKQPHERYASASAMAADIERYLAGLPVLARGASWTYRMRKFIARHRAGAAAVSFAFVVLLAAVLALGLQARKTAIQRDLAEAQAARAEAARAYLVEIISHADPFAGAGEVTVAGALKKSVAGIADRFEGQPALEAEMRFAIGYALQNLGETDAAEEQLRVALQLRSAEGNQFEQAKVLDALALVDWWRSDFAAGEQKFIEALALTDDPDDPQQRALRVEILTNFSGMLSEPGDHRRAIEHARQAIDLADGLGPALQPTLATAHNNLATAQESLGDYESALQSFERSLQLRRAVDGEMHPDYAITLNNLAFLYSSLDRHEQAVDTFGKALEIESQLLSPEHPELAISLMNLSWAELRIGRLDSALAHAERALAISLASYPGGHPRTAKVHETLASVHLAGTRRELAAQHAHKALSIYADHPDVNPAWIAAARTVLEQAESEPTELR